MSTINPISAVWQILKEAPSVYALTGQRVYPRNLAQNVGYPAVVYSQLSDNSVSTKDGVASVDIDFRIEIYAETYTTAQDIAEAVKNTLTEYEGSISGIGSVANYLNDQNDAPWEGDVELFKIVQDYNLQTC